MKVSSEFLSRNCCYKMTDVLINRSEHTSGDTMHSEMPDKSGDIKLHVCFYRWKVLNCERAN